VPGPACCRPTVTCIASGRSGVELSEPHWHCARAAALLRDGGFDRILAAVHSAPAGAGFTEISSCYSDQAPAQVLLGYLAETAALISQFDGGKAITFASDAHDPAVLAAGFADAAHFAEAAGFAVGDDPYGPWVRKTFLA
jgi:hypothetical protein